MKKNIYVGLLLVLASSCAPIDEMTAEAPSAFTLAPTATAALVYNTKQHQSPIHASPGDTMIIPGGNIRKGAQVVYRLVTNPHLALTAPQLIPVNNTQTVGRLILPSSGTASAYSDVPHSLTVQMPLAMRAGAIYALWVKNPKNAPYSEPVLINDPRPEWSTPNRAHVTSPLGPLGRRFKVIGRNLTSVRGSIIVRLEGPQSYSVVADAAPSLSMRDHAVYATLPAVMAVGHYTVSVRISGIWYPAPNGSLDVLPDPTPVAIFSVSNQGCAPDDGLDDTACIEAAVAAAVANRGGTVAFAPGQWDLIDPAQTGEHPHYGITVPRGVNLTGAAGAVSRIVKHASWTTLTVFTLQGQQFVQHLQLEENVVAGAAPTQTVFFRLGHLTWVLTPSDPRVIDDVTITNCTFTDMDEAVASSGLPTRRLIVADNRFAAYRNALSFSGNPTALHIRYAVTDSTITRNLFEPGAYQDVSITQGTIASHFGASSRLDFSDNIADGRLNGGWRAAYFFHMSSSHDMLLISRNSASCTGDKGGDGEAIIFDNNHNVAGFDKKQRVVAASNNSLSVNAALREATPDYYLDAWVQVVGGPGVGQVRRILRYKSGSSTSIYVSPAWDVVPVVGQSEITVTRVFHSTAIVDNTIDNRGCDPTEALGHEGMIGWAAMTIDSVIASNRQYNTGGIYVGTSYVPAPNQFRFKPYIYAAYAGEIKGNLISGRALRDRGGLGFWYGSAPQPGATLTHNINVHRNRIDSANATNNGIIGGAIATMQGWYVAQPVPIGPSRIVIHHNLISNVQQGVTFDHSYVQRNVVADNIFSGVATPLVDNGTDTLFLP